MMDEIFELVLKEARSRKEIPLYLSINLVLLELINRVSTVSLALFTQGLLDLNKDDKPA